MELMLNAAHCPVWGMMIEYMSTVILTVCGLSSARPKKKCQAEAETSGLRGWGAVKDREGLYFPTL